MKATNFLLALTSTAVVSAGILVRDPVTDINTAAPPAQTSVEIVPDETDVPMLCSADMTCDSTESFNSDDFAIRRTGAIPSFETCTIVKWAITLEYSQVIPADLPPVAATTSAAAAPGCYNQVKRIWNKMHRCCSPAIFRCCSKS
ncbi:hypothetical protein BUE80_DR001922 [Diplocarpon rosae]|nr:hypothetical protein BUE80_DR001922 [Diplocarpon rosae]